MWFFFRSSAKLWTLNCRKSAIESLATNDRKQQKEQEKKTRSYNDFIAYSVHYSCDAKAHVVDDIQSIDVSSTRASLDYTLFIFLFLFQTKRFFPSACPLRRRVSLFIICFFFSLSPCADISFSRSLFILSFQIQMLSLQWWRDHHIHYSYININRWAYVHCDKIFHWSIRNLFGDDFGGLQTAKTRQAKKKWRRRRTL